MLLGSGLSDWGLNQGVATGVSSFRGEYYTTISIGLFASPANTNLSRHGIKGILCLRFHNSPDCVVALVCYVIFTFGGPTSVKVLIADNERGRRDFLHNLVEQNQDIQVCGIAVDADRSPECVVARELRRILDGCPICDGGFRDHTYFKLATVAMNEKADDAGRLAEFLQCMRDCRWCDVLDFRQWIASADAIVAFAFRCEKGRVGIVTVFSPAASEAPDEPLQFTILSLEEGKKLTALVEPRQWMQLRPTLHFVH